MRAGVVTPARLEAALADLSQGGAPRRLAAALVERGDVDERDLARVLSQELSVPWVSLASADPPRSVCALVPRDIAERFSIAPVYVRREPGGPSTLFVAIDDPTWEEALYTTSVFAGMSVRPVIAPRREIQSAIARWYRRRSSDDRPTLPALSMRDDVEEIVVMGREAAFSRGQ